MVAATFNQCRRVMYSMFESAIVSSVMLLSCPWSLLVVYSSSKERAICIWCYNFFRSHNS